MAEATISLRLTLHSASDSISPIDAREPRRPAAPARGEINRFDTPHHDPGEHRQ